MRKKSSLLLSFVSIVVVASTIAMSCKNRDNEEVPTRDYTIPPMPTYASLPGNPKLPDPFKFMNGTRMVTKEEWKYRRAEIAA